MTKSDLDGPGDAEGAPGEFNEIIPVVHRMLDRRGVISEAITGRSEVADIAHAVVLPIQGVGEQERKGAVSVERHSPFLSDTRPKNRSSLGLKTMKETNASKN